ncbi:hypothetical protein HRbin21_00377 [bacterium HR21]|nr:hypothetical protein HRbin21_00377 [bacterium HR21]
MKACLWGLVGGLLSTLCYAQSHVELPFRVGNELGEALTLVVGVDERATERIDTLLGEQELPPMHPPRDVFHAVLRFYDSADGEWKWTYRDFRPLRQTDTFSIEYRLLVQRGSGRNIVLRWSYPLPEAIDSAVLSDRVTGSLVRIRFDGAQEGTVTNEFLEEFALRVWYRFPVTVWDAHKEPGLGAVGERAVWLYDLLGRLCWYGNHFPPAGGIPEIASGLYIGVEQHQGRWRRFLWWKP